jgi:hypothetical protein
MTDLSVLADCAFHIANTVIRHDAAGDVPAASRAHDRLAVLLETTPGDDLILTLARRLGRNRALAVMIDPEVIELACRAA